jgi:hypothetical protein
VLGAQTTLPVLSDTHSNHVYNTSNSPRDWTNFYLCLCESYIVRVKGAKMKETGV